MRFASCAADWDRVVKICEERGRVGFDTETYGHDITKTSAAHRARVHVWSLAVRTNERHARGFYKARGVMLPAAALEYRPIVELLERSDIPKVAHNLPHDAHAVRNHGIQLRGGIDTLPLSRLVLPMEMSHGLKPLMENFLGRRVITFEEVLTEPNVVTIVKRKAERGCICGNPVCRRRGSDHVRVTWKRFTPETLVRGTRLMPLESVVPGHERFDKLTTYAIQDAEGVLELENYLARINDRVVIDSEGVPWCLT